MALPNLRRLFLPVLAGGVTLGLTWYLYSVVQAINKEIADKSAAYAATPGVALWNPLTWGNLPREVQEDLDLKATWLKGQIVAGAMFLVGIGGGLVTTYLVWKDLLQSPTSKAMEEAALRQAASISDVRTRAAIVEPVLPGASQAVAAAPIPAIGNPETFERGTKARAVRDVLARHIAKGGGAEEPFAVATARVKDLGPEKAAEGLPAEEIAAELKEQTEAAA